MSENDNNKELSSEELNNLLDDYIASIENRGGTGKSHSDPLPDDILLPEVTGERTADPELSAAESPRGPAVLVSKTGRLGGRRGRRAHGKGRLLRGAHRLRQV